MDGKRLRLYLIEKSKERLPYSIGDEVASALLFSPDPAVLVLDALEEFYPKEDKGDAEIDIRKTCVHLLHRLMKISPLSIRPQVSEEAKRMALEWKDKVRGNGKNNNLETLGILLLIATYQLAPDFNANNELYDLVEIVARRNQAPELCRVFGFSDKSPDFVQNLIIKGKQLDAIKFIYKFGLLDKFPAFPLLRAHLGDAKKAGKEICKNGKNSPESQTEAADVEIAAIRAVIRCIEMYKIECKYNSDNLRKRFKQLVWLKRDLRRNIAQPQQQSGNKRRYLEAVPAPNTVLGGSSVVHPIQRPYLHATGAFTDQNSARNS